MTVSTYQLYRDRFMIVYDYKNIRYKKFTRGASLVKIIAGAVQIYFRVVKNSITKLLRG